MLRLLLDEQISYVVADGLKTRRPDRSIISVHHWRDGKLLGQRDHQVLLAAVEDGLTLITYDQQTIPPLTVEWWEVGLVHTGVIFVDERTVRSDDYGGLIRALEALWDREGDADWTNRIMFLDAANA